jgi:hypothetical protein
MSSLLLRATDEWFMPPLGGLTYLFLADNFLREEGQGTC